MASHHQSSPRDELDGAWGFPNPSRCASRAEACAISPSTSETGAGRQVLAPRGRLHHQTFRARLADHVAFAGIVVWARPSTLTFNPRLMASGPIDTVATWKRVEVGQFVAGPCKRKFDGSLMLYRRFNQKKIFFCQKGNRKDPAHCSMRYGVRSSMLIHLQYSRNSNPVYGCVQFQNLYLQTSLFTYHIKSFASCMEH